MSRAKPIPYVFTPVKVKAPATEPAPAPRPAGGIVAQAIDGWTGYTELHAELTAGQPEADVLGGWVSKDTSRALTLVSSLLSSGNHEACVLVADALLGVFDDDDYLMPDLLYYRGTARTNMDAADHGIPDLERLANDYVDEGHHGHIPPAWALNNLAWAYYCHGDFDVGVEVSRRAVEADPDNGPGQSTLAGLLWETGEEEAALLAFAAGLKRGVGPESLPDDMQTDARVLEIVASDD